MSEFYPAMSDGLTTGIIPPHKSRLTSEERAEVPHVDQVVIMKIVCMLDIDELLNFTKFIATL